MSTTRLEVKGLRELGQAMNAMGVDVVKASVRATGPAGAAGLVRDAAKQNIRTSPSIETGSLLAAVIVKKIPKSQTKLTSEHIVTVRGRGKPTTKKGKKIDRAPYAFHVEFGTVNMPAEPFLRPALENNVQPAIGKMADSLRTSIAKAAAKAAKK